jgi:hypothetical protein
MSDVLDKFDASIEVPLIADIPEAVRFASIIRECLVEYEHGGAATTDELHPNLTMEKLCWVATQMTFEFASGEEWLRPRLPWEYGAAYDDLQVWYDTYITL